MRSRWAAACLVFGALEGGDEPNVPPPAKRIEHDDKAFRPDPAYEDKPYDPKAQQEIYGGKRENPNPRPMLELGRPLYREGPFHPGARPFGGKNLVFQHLMVYGDWRSAVAANDNKGKQQALAATRLNLDFDWKLTATERFHAFVAPLQDDGQFTRHVFGGEGEETEFESDVEPKALFFEGDAGAIRTGLSGKESRSDLPFAAGLMPLLFQNGVWVEDAFTGFAAAIPARNSPVWDIANADVTFFAGVDEVSSGAVVADNGVLAEHNANLYGVAGFIETNEGYWELDYGYTDAQGSLSDLDYHNVAAAFTRRYGNLFSNSVRVVANLGQETDRREETAKGAIVLVENAMITKQPWSFVPYLNLFAGFDRPQSLARDPGAGGILKNTGILFETDGLTGFPKLDDTGQDAYGGALGVEYLFDLKQQVVFEVASVNVIDGGNEASRPAKGDQLGLGARYQVPLSSAWILRFDAMTAGLEKEKDLSGIRMELRRKF